MRWWQVGEVTYSCSASIGYIVVHTNWLSGSYFAWGTQPNDTAHTHEMEEIFSYQNRGQLFAW